MGGQPRRLGGAAIKLGHAFIFDPSSLRTGCTSRWAIQHTNAENLRMVSPPYASSGYPSFVYVLTALLPLSLTQIGLVFCAKRPGEGLSPASWLNRAHFISLSPDTPSALPRPVPHPMAARISGKGAAME
jgi:hypothetical protein